MFEIPKWLYDENLPEYRRLRILPFLFYSFFISFWISYGFLWALFEPFGFGDFIFEKFCGKNVGKWTILVFLSICFSMIYTIFRLYRYYHGLYHIVKDTNLFYNIYPNRTWLEDHFIDFLKDAKKNFFLVSISGNSFSSTPKIEETIERKITAADNQCKVQILIHHEQSLFVEVREMDERRNSGHIVRDCKENYEKWHNFRQRHTSRLFFVKRQKEFSIGSFCLLVDDVLYFEPYLAYNSGRHCPLFVIHKNQNNERVFSSIVEQMTELWDTAID